MSFWKLFRASKQPREQPPLPRFQTRRPAQTTEEVTPGEVTGATITDEQIRQLLNEDWLSEWEARGAFRYALDREEASDPRRARAYAAEVFNRYLAART